MEQDTLKKIEEKIAASTSIDGVRKVELMELLTTLKDEVEELATTHDEEAKTISNFAKTSAHEAVRDNKKPELLDIALKGLNSSVDGFEASHPKLVRIVNSISMMFSNIGI